MGQHNKTEGLTLGSDLVIDIHRIPHSNVNLRHLQCAKISGHNCNVRNTQVIALIVS